MDSVLKVVSDDPWLKPVENILLDRRTRFENCYNSIKESYGCLENYASAYLHFGFQRDEVAGGWRFTEWLPRANAVFIFGDFNNWDKYADRLTQSEFNPGEWEILLPDHKYGNTLLDGSKYKLLVINNNVEYERIPAYTQSVIQDDITKVFDARFLNPKKPFNWGDDKNFVPQSSLFIYECHIGMAQQKYGYGTYKEFTETILPYIKNIGYNALQIMAIAEHPYYGSFGYHVSNFYAPSFRFGTPEDLKKLVRTAHSMGIAVIMDIVHSHFVKNTNEGLNMLDGADGLYSKPEPYGNHPYWDSKLFDYGKEQVRRFLLSNINYWMKEFHFDGFRFDGVSSMLYYHHGYVDFGSYESYFGSEVDNDALLYLTLANTLIKEINPKSITIAEDVSGMPALCSPVDDGGVGFDYRLAMSIPDYWIKLLKEYPDENWPLGQLWHIHVDRLWNTKNIAYSESHDQALVGDKTLAFRLMDKQMYWSMNKESDNFIIDRGIALHKMIRIFTLTTGGQAYLNFMGNEFGHPEWIDFPRQGNNWSFQYACRQWSLVFDSNLKYIYLYDFDKAMLAIAKTYNLLSSGYPELLYIHEDDKIIAYKAGELIFVFNWNPTESFVDYRINVSWHGRYKIVLNSDSTLYGGYERIDMQKIFFTSTDNNGNPYIQTYCVNRAVMVYEKIAENENSDILKLINSENEY